MNSSYIDRDTRPWHRQFWPWFLISLPASAVLAGLATLYIANRHADDMVIDDYYKNGLAINRQLEKKQRALELGLSADLDFDAQTVTLRTGGPIGSPQLLLRLSHPLEAKQDFTISLTAIGNDLYQGALLRPVNVNWHWVLEYTGDPSWLLDGSITAADFGNAPK